MSSIDTSNVMQAQNTVFYLTEKAIKLYRRFAQSKIKEHHSDITIDQLLILEKLESSPDISYSELAEYIFKDSASVSRMLSLLEKNNFIDRISDENNRRRFKTKVTSKGKNTLNDVKPLRIKNRKTALKGISKKDVDTCKKVLNQISNNLTN